MQQLPLLRINPEAIIQGSGLEALQVTSFLAENYTHFFSGDAMDEVAEAATHLSDAGVCGCVCVWGGGGKSVEESESNSDWEMLAVRLCVKVDWCAQALYNSFV